MVGLSLYKAILLVIKQALLMIQIPQPFTKRCMAHTVKSTYRLWMKRYVPSNAHVRGMSKHNPQFLQKQTSYRSRGSLSLNATLTDDCASSRHAYVYMVIAKLKVLTTLISMHQSLAGQQYACCSHSPLGKNL